MTTRAPRPRPDHPDRAERLRRVLLRDGGTCTWCGRELTGLARPTTDHLVPRVKGGPSWLENEVAACARCNRQRGHTSPSDWLARCRDRGWRPARDRVVAALEALESAIDARGGQRRARHYVDQQLRRLRKE